MSLIFGKVNLGGQDIHAENIYDRMQTPHSKYQTDAAHRISDSNVLFACNLQHITLQSLSEVLPFHDSERDIYYTADCMLDNRESLIAELSAKSDVTDGRLIYEAYLKWGEEAVCKHLVGSFAFAIYEAKKNRFLLYTDHTSSRCIYYTVANDTIGFSTTIQALLYGFPEKKFTHNEQWITACECNFSPNVMMFPALTPIKDILQLPNGHYLWMQGTSYGLQQYWNPRENIKSLTGYKRAEYHQMVIDAMNQAIAPTLRSIGNTGILLSSGMDSASVACFAAPMLSKSGKSLYAYTSIPLSEYNEKENEKDFINEQPGVERICAKYPNILPHYISSQGKDPLSENDRISDYLEQPLKATSNLYWMDDLYSQARKDNCKIVLNGQNGNPTISYGNYLSLPYQEFLGGKLRSSLRHLKTYKKLCQQSSFELLGLILSQLKTKFIADYTLLDSNLMYDNLLKKYDIKNTLKKQLCRNGGTMMDSRREMIGNMTNDLYFQHTGVHSTKEALANGIVVRDPLRNPKLIELCLSLPIECFFDKGFGRVVVRECFWDIVPLEILQDQFGRGRQSADFCYRLNQNWEKYTNNFFSALSDPILSSYIDPKKKQAVVTELKQGYEHWNQENMMQGLALQSFSHYLHTTNAILSQ